MSGKWPTVRLGEVARPVERPEVPIPGKLYRQIGVRLWGNGAYEREAIDGGQTRYVTLSRVEVGDIIVNKIWARNGSVAVVSDDLAGCHGSSEFPTFAPLRERLEPRWFHWYTKTRGFWDQCDEKSRGTSGKNRIRPERFLEIAIPLPSLEEQRRIAARIEELAAKVEEARGLRRKAAQTTASLISAVHVKLAEARVVRLGETLVLDERREDVVPGGAYPQVGVKGFGEGLFARETLEATQTTYRAFNRLYDGAVVLSQVKGWEGAVAVCPPELATRYVSPEYRTFQCVPGMTMPEYLARLIPTPWFWTRLAALTRGAGARRERIRPEYFLDVQLPMPTIEQQQAALRLFSRVEGLRGFQAGAAREIDALLPAILDRAFRGEL